MRTKYPKPEYDLGQDFSSSEVDSADTSEPTNRIAAVLFGHLRSEGS
ncbi:hypothetical protein J2T13_005182 [Paenibacillus sp. DS2015]